MKFNEPIYNRKRSEAEIQADLYHSIKQLGLDPKMEVKGFLFNPSRKKCRQICRFDIVVFWPLNHKPLCIVECKGRSHIKKGSRQIAKYQLFHLPVVKCCKDDHDSALSQIKSMAIDDRSNAPPSMKQQIVSQCGVSQQSTTQKGNHGSYGYSDVNQAFSG